MAQWDDIGSFLNNVLSSAGNALSTGAALVGQAEAQRGGPLSPFAGALLELPAALREQSRQKAAIPQQAEVLSRLSGGKLSTEAAQSLISTNPDLFKSALLEELKGGAKAPELKARRILQGNKLVDQWYDPQGNLVKTTDAGTPPPKSAGGNLGVPFTDFLSAKFGPNAATQYLALPQAQRTALRQQWLNEQNQQTQNRSIGTFRAEMPMRERLAQIEAGNKAIQPLTVQDWTKKWLTDKTAASGIGPRVATGLGFKQAVPNRLDAYVVQQDPDSAVKLGLAVPTNRTKDGLPAYRLRDGKYATQLEGP